MNGHFQNTTCEWHIILNESETVGLSQHTPNMPHFTVIMLFMPNSVSESEQVSLLKNILCSLNLSFWLWPKIDKTLKGFHRSKVAATEWTELIKKKKTLFHWRWHSGTACLSIRQTWISCTASTSLTVHIISHDQQQECALKLLLTGDIQWALIE